MNGKTYIPDPKLEREERSFSKLHEPAQRHVDQRICAA
jgi:hypothetical protein